MSWVRIHDGAMTHPKVVALSDKAFRLWVWGLSYAQQHLTDGALPAAAMPVRVKRASADLVRVGLWLAVGDGFQIHDYLDWNDSRSVVLDKRAEAKERMANARQRSQIVRANGLDRTSPEVLRRSGLERRDPEKEMSSAPHEIVGINAGRFVERYQELFTELRRGAKYHPKPALDWQRACDLLKTWDVPRLEKMARVFLTTDDDWIAQTDRGFGVFCARATWCDDRLRAVEKAPA